MTPEDDLALGELEQEVAGQAQELVLDEGAWEEVLTLDPDDADNLQDLLEDTDTVHYDVERRVLMFGVAKVGD